MSNITRASIESLQIAHSNAICYSGYRENQCPRAGIYPSYEQVKEDLLILQSNWSYLRIYDCGPHAELVLDVITTENLPFKVMLGVDLAAEMSNPNCPWGANFSDEQINANRQKNCNELHKAIKVTKQYEDIIFSVSIGNEASVDWTDHMVPVDRLVNYVKQLKKEISQPITFCENYVPWTYKLEPLVEVLDFISVHTYPAWEYRTMEDALEYTKQNYYSVADHYPDKPVVITEAGWTTASNGRGIEPWNANEDLQLAYYQQLMNWTNEEKILTFVFEAFDEPWKGSADPLEPEKHWGLFYVDRTPKLVMKEQFSAHLSLVHSSE